MAKELTKAKNVELLYSAPAGHDEPHIWVPLTDVLGAGSPLDPDEEQELEYLDIFRIQMEDGSYQEFQHVGLSIGDQFDDLEDEDLDKCQVCRIDFPAELINTLVSTEGSISCCPVCALRNRNKNHGMKMSEPFRGEIANLMYNTAVQFLKHTKQWSNPDGLPE